MAEEQEKSFLDNLIELSAEIAHGHYERVNDLFQITAAAECPKDLAALAEAMGMMLVKIEAREFRLEQTIGELKQTQKELEAAKQQLYMENIQLADEIKRLRIVVDTGEGEIPGSKSEARKKGGKHGLDKDLVFTFKY